MGDFNAEPNEPAISNFCEIYNNKNKKRKLASKILQIRHA